MLMKYSEVLKLAKEKVSEALAPLRAREMRKKGELEICKLEGEIAEKEQKVQEIASKYPLVYDNLIDQLDELDLLTRRKEQLEKIIDGLFSDEKPAK